MASSLFRIWRLERMPALLLGMEVTGQLDAITIDYQLSRVWFTAKGAATIRVGSTGSATRAPVD